MWIRSTKLGRSKKYFHKKKIFLIIQENDFTCTFRMYGEHEYNLIEVLHEISFLKGTSYYIQEFCFGDDPLDCPKSGFKELAMKVFSSPKF